MTKLPGQPKKNQSAYFLWMNTNREKIKKDFPGLSMTDMSKKAGELWRDLQDKTVSENIKLIVIFIQNIITDTRQLVDNKCNVIFFL